MLSISLSNFHIKFYFNHLRKNKSEILSKSATDDSRCVTDRNANANTNRFKQKTSIFALILLRHSALLLVSVFLAGRRVLIFVGKILVDKAFYLETNIRTRSGNYVTVIGYITVRVRTTETKVVFFNLQTR